MNSSSGKGSMSTESSSAAGWKSGDVVPDQFPAGLRVLAVDDDRTCLVILEKMLRTCLYEVKTCERAMTALSMLRENKNWFDIVISDVHMPDMDGFKLLEHIGLEMDLPVIMMSADDGKHVVMKGVTHGACDYLIKPVRIEALKNIWQHVVRKRRNEWKDFEQLGSVEEGDRQPKESDDADYSSVANEGNWKSSKKRKYDSDETNERDDTSTLKKPRVVWSVELHQQFVAAVNQLGIDKNTKNVKTYAKWSQTRSVGYGYLSETEAVPKKILELMNIPGLTRENVASHLQKYRLYLRRLSVVPLHQSNLNDSFVSSQEATFGALSSLNGLDVQTLAATGRVPAQSPAAFQAVGLGRSAAKAGVPMTLVDQRNSFSFENPKLIFREGLQQHTNTNKQMNLLNGIPTTMEPKQLAGLHHAAQSIGNINMQVTSSNGAQSSRNGSLSMRMAQPRSRGQMLDDSTAGHALRLPSSIGRPILSNGIPENMRTAGYNPVSQTSLMLNFPVNHSSELPGNSFPLGSTPGMASITSKENSQEDINSENEGVGGFMPGYEIFNDLDQHKFENWELQNVVMTFDASQHSNSHQGNLDLVQSVLVQQGFSSVQVNGQNGNAAVVSKAIMFSAGDIPKPENAQNVNQHLDSLLVDNTITVKSERFADASPANLFPDHIRQEDVMSAVLKQREGISLAENEFDFNGYSMDNPV